MGVEIRLERNYILENRQGEKFRWLAGIFGDAVESSCFFLEIRRDLSLNNLPMVRDVVFRRSFVVAGDYFG